jgi:hypothetical protein
MKSWFLAIATLVMIGNAEAREHWGPPQACPQPKEDCCPKTKCPPADKKSRSMPTPFKACEPKQCAPKCPETDPCCPTVCFERGHETDPCCLPSAYNEPAAIDLRCGADVYTSLSFIYWEAIQGGMDLAVPGQTDGASSAVGNSVLFQDFQYKPGFQIGLGWTGMKDDWTLSAEYTWLHGQTSTSQGAPAIDVTAIDGVAVSQPGVWIPSSWIPSANLANTADHISSKWHYKVDLLDVQMSRPFYSGTRLTFEPFFGLRGAWIRQHLDVTATTATTSREGDYSSTSRAVGPRVGLNGNWHLGVGFRFIGNAAASLLFTDYDVRQNVERISTTTLPISVKIEDHNEIRPNFDLGLGLGWSSYFSCRRFHWDLTATYDFSVFSQQNMMRYLADLSLENSHTNGAASDLFLQGLTLQTQFEF